MVPHRLVGEGVRYVFFLKEAVPDIALVGENVAHSVNGPRLPVPWLNPFAVKLLRDGHLAHPGEAHFKNPADNSGFCFLDFQLTVL